jgi:stage V sporulation protein SpoVS
VADNIEVVKVSAKSPVPGVAGCIAQLLEQGKTVEVRSIGAGSLNQAFKAVAKARGHMAVQGRDLIVRPGYGDTTIEGEEKTLLKQFVSLL